MLDSAHGSNQELSFGFTITITLISNIKHSKPETRRKESYVVK